MRSLLVVLAVLVLASAGCDVTDIPVERKPAPAGGAPEGTWWLVRGTTRDGPIEPFVESPITLLFRDGRAGGEAVCNMYGGTVQIEGERIAFGEIVSTLMACRNEREMAAEGAYLSALRRVNRIRLSDENTLVLSGRGTKLTFMQIDAAVEG